MFLALLIVISACGCNRPKAQVPHDDVVSSERSESDRPAWAELFRWPSGPLEFASESRRLRQGGASNEATGLLELYVDQVGRDAAVVLELCRQYEADRRFGDVLELLDGFELEGWGGVAVVGHRAEAAFYTSDLDLAESGYLRLAELSSMVPEGLSQIVIGGLCRVHLARRDYEQCRELINANTDVLEDAVLIELTEYILEYLEGSATTTHFLLSSAVDERTQTLRDSLGVRILLSGGHYDIAEFLIPEIAIGSILGEREALLAFLALGRGDLQAARAYQEGALAANGLFADAGATGAVLFWRESWGRAWQAQSEGRFEDARNILLDDRLSIEVGWIPR